MSAVLAPDQRQVAWMAVGAAWQSNARECEDCPFRHTWSERHPYGDTTATETLTECGLNEPYSPQECPALAEQGEA